ncbi:MAG TPA: sigma-70 family RNA polymerase sigma factor [Tepidisphaeraceae bacterium]|jgi:RNA polymerase sigma factor (sigma-70 family)|nr:sigma-70 family RNA polymerase sigma factor [Tepidisphaeraceae bacterium]
MSELSQGEQYLVNQIRAGSAEGWSQLVERFEGRLLAFAASRSIKRADAEDLVQETFVKFLGGLPTYREEASLETYLFMILRRRIIDFLRGRKPSVCLMQEGDDDEPMGIEPPAPDLTASTYARRDEQLEQFRSILGESLGQMIGGLKESENFRDLKIVEMLFYAQLRNKEIAKLMGMDEKAIALIKHRWLKQLRERVEGRLKDQDLSALEAARADSLLTDIWESQRLSCAKRNTVGGYLLKTLEPAWQDYVQFHVEKLGCHFCRANLDDLKNETKQAPRALRDRVMQSTVGFFRKN